MTSCVLFLTKSIRKRVVINNASIAYIYTQKQKYVTYNLVFRIHSRTSRVTRGIIEYRDKKEKRIKTAKKMN